VLKVKVPGGTVEDDGWQRRISVAPLGSLIVQRLVPSVAIRI
jgi:hypothetical protein